MRMMNKVIKTVFAAPLALGALFVIGSSAAEADEHVYTACYERSCKSIDDAIKQGTCENRGENTCSQLAIALLTCDQACKAEQRSSELCKAKIRVINLSGRQIRTFYVRIYDFQAKKWRRENIRNTTLDHGGIQTERANLAGIKDEKFKIILHFKRRKGKYIKWPIKTDRSQTVTMGPCRNDAIYTIDIK